MTKELISKLREIGLNEYEAMVYVTLVEIGKSSSGTIAAKSGVPYGRIYDVLESLVRKGMVVIAPEKPKKWYAHPPSAVLKRLIDKKISTMNELSKEIEQLTKKHDLFPEQTVYVVKGKENFHRIVNKTEPKQSNFRIKWDFLDHPMWINATKRKIKRGIDIRTMGPLNTVTKDRIKKWLKAEKHIKEFPNQGCPIGIVDDECVFIGLIDADITIMIKHAGFAEIMKNLFLDSWKNRKDIKPSELR